MKNKRGSYVILATILFSSMMILTAAVLHASGENAIASTADSFGRLWGRSILAEYDIKLKDRYGIFAFYGDELSVAEKVDFYAEYSARGKKYIDIEPSKCSLEEYRLSDTENFTAQLREAVLTDTKPLQTERKKSAAVGSSEGNAEAEGKAEDKAVGRARENRYIKSERIIAALPSGGKEGGISVLGLAERLKEGFSAEAVVNSAAENIYMFRFFKDCMNDRRLGESFFENEIEYILTGKLDDAKAKNKVKSNLTLLRNSLNLAYLYSCDEKRNAALAAAELIMPEAPMLAQALILEGWAYMEARNDIKILYAGREVPILKKDENWAVSLDNLLTAEYGIDSSGAEAGTGSEAGSDSGSKAEKASASETASNYLSPAKIEGKNYEDYLRILAAALPQETALLRMMDIIQINMKYLYCDYFLMYDYYVGLKYSIVINDREHEFEEKY